jgi:plasmid stabilization system protein ParE
MRIVWTRKAVRHLADIQTYIERDKPQAARKVAAAIRMGSRRLFQEIGQCP